MNLTKCRIKKNMHFMFETNDKNQTKYFQYISANKGLA